MRKDYKFKKLYVILFALFGMTMFVKASTVDNLTSINSTSVFAFGDYVSDGTDGIRSTGKLFGNGFFLDVKGGSVSTAKGSIDIATTSTYTAVNGADADYLSSTYTSYGSRLNCLRFKNADNLIALKPVAGSTIYLFGNGNGKSGTAARIPKFATDASLSTALNDAPDASFPSTGNYVYVFEVPDDFDGTKPLYIGSYNGDAYFSFIIVECPELFKITANSIPEAGGSVSVTGRTTSDDNTSEEITVKAFPNDNYAFKEWQDAEGNVLSTEAEYTFTATKDTEINAVFYVNYSEKSPATKLADKNIPIAGESYTIEGTYNAGGNLGTAYGNMLSQGGVKLRTGNAGNTIRFDVNPGWKITGITLSMYANDEGTIDVISASVDGNAVADFTTVTLPSNTAKAATDITLENISAQTSIVFGFDNTNVVKNNQVFVTYVISYDKAGVYNIDATCSPVAGGTIVLDQNTQADGKTDEVILTATANDHYTFKEWQDANGAQLSTDNPYTFDATADKEVVAVFVEDPKYTVTYELGEGVEGQAPTAVTDYEGGSATVPANFTVYKEGYTLTGWTDGSNSYVANDVITIGTSDITLTPVFTENTTSLANRTAAVTLTWDFQRQNGAPSVAWQNQEGLIWVTQAEVNGETIDVKCDFSTNPGKFANGNWTDWCQLNGGTKFTIPSCEGAVVSIEAHSAMTTTSIDGKTDYTSDKTISYTVANTAEEIDIVIGDGSYFRYIQTVLPALTLTINDTEVACPDFAPTYSNYAKAVYNRELNTGYTYGLICLPFAPDAESLTNFQFYTLSSVADDAVTFTEVDAPVANTPYLYSIKEGAARTSTITGGETTVSTEVNNTTVGTWTLVGSLKNETIDCTADATTYNYIFNPAQNTLHRVKTTLTVYPYTAYLKNDVASTQNSLSQMRVFIGTPTGIKEISRDQIEGFGDKAGMFDLQGRALSNPVKGQIYIENGEKKIKN